MKRSSFTVLLISLLIVNLCGLAITLADMHKSKTITFNDVVQQLSLAVDKSYYRVTFRGKAAFYKASRSDALMACLEKLALKASQVTVEMNGENLKILKCTCEK